MKDQLQANSSLPPFLEGLVIGIDHIGICVDDLNSACASWQTLLGRSPVDNETLTSQKVHVAFMEFPSQETSVEFVCPMLDNPTLRAYVRKRGDALHHIAFRVQDIVLALTRLSNAGVLLIDTSPRIGARGHQVAFLHPKAMGGTLVELVEHSCSSTRSSSSTKA